MTAPVQTLAIAAGLAVAAGLVTTLQPAFNGRLSGIVGSPLKAAFISFFAGTSILFLALVVTRASVPPAETLGRIPWYLWVGGGAFGAFFVTSAAWSAPRVGVGTYLAILVAAQLITALTLDHFGVSGLAERAITPMRAAGAGLLVLGAVLVTRG